MAQPIQLRFRADTEQARLAVSRLGTVVAQSMASVSAAAVASHGATGTALDGMGQKALTAAKAVGALAAAHQVAVSVFATYLTAVAAGAAELEKFQRLAEKAAASNVGTTYFQAFTVGAAQLGAKLKEVEADLAALEKSTRDRFSGDSLTGRQNKAVERFEQAFLDVPTSQGSPALDMLRNATNAEERLRAVTQGLMDLEAQGRRLLAIDIARDLGLRDLPELVERGKTTFVDFAFKVRELEATGIKNGSLISPDLITRAGELRERFGAVATNLANNVRPVLDECARLALDIGNSAAWTAEQFNRVVGVVGSIVRFLREGVDLIGKLGRSDVGSGILASSRIDGLREEIQHAQKQLEAIPQPRFGADIRAAERETLQARIVQMRGEIEALSQMAAEERRGRALAGLPPPAREPIIPTDRAATKAPPLDPNARSGSSGASEETDKRTEAVKRFIDSQEKANEVLRAELATIGLGTVEKEKALALARAEAEAKRNNGTLTQTERDRVIALAEAHGRLRDAVKEATEAQKALADAFQYVGDRIIDIAFRGGKVQDVFKGIATEMARAALTGQGVFAKLLGLAPPAGAPAGSLGGLFGAIMGGPTSGVTYTGGGGGGGGGLFGGLLGSLFGGGGLFGGLGGGFLSPFGLFHDGGMVGDGRMSGYAPAAMFAGARRFHGGGGLAPDEVPIIGQVGEEMLTKNQRRAVAQSLAMGEEAMGALSRQRGGVVVEGNSYNFQGVTAADRAWITAEMDRRDAQNAARIIPAVQDADRAGVEIQPYTKGM